MHLNLLVFSILLVVHQVTWAEDSCTSGSVCDVVNQLQERVLILEQNAALESAPFLQASNLKILSASKPQSEAKYPISAILDGKLETEQDKDGGGHCYVSSDEYKDVHFTSSDPYIELGLDQFKIYRVRILMRTVNTSDHYETNINKHYG